MSALRGFIAAVSRLVPAETRREFRDEWHAELAQHPSWTRAIGAVPDAWFLCRQPWSIEMVMQDVRYAVRLLVRDRALTAAAVVTLALAIGANAAVFSVLDAVMLRPIPARDPGRLVVAWQTAQHGTRLQAVFSYPDYRDWTETARAAERTALVTWSSATITGTADAERLQSAAVTAGFFELLGVPVQGRLFSAGDEAAAADRVAIVSERFRAKHLAAVAQPVGALITVNGLPRRVVGVVTADPLDGVFGPAADLWVPIQQRPQLEERGNRNFTALARLAPGAAPLDAERELAALMKRLEAEYPQTNAGRGGRVITLQDQMSGSSRRGLMLAASAAALLLLVACANVASLLVARGLTRGAEFATRVALGASRVRLIRQLTIESLALAAAGAAAGLALFALSVPLLLSLLPPATPRTFLIGWSPRLVLFAAGMACVVAVIASLPSAWRTGRQAGSRTTTGGGGAQTVLAGAQLATATVVLVVAGLLAASVARLQRVDAGFAPERMLTLQLQLSGAAYDTPAAAVAFVDRLLARVDALPSVEGAAVLDPAPFSGHINRWDTTSDAGVAIFKTDRYLATPSAFDALHLRATRGRLFTAADRRVAVVDTVFAAQAFPGLDPLGRTFTLESNPPRMVVGVVPHIKHYGLDEDPRPQVYLPFASDPSDWLNLVVSSRLDAAATIADVRQAVRETDPGIAPYDAATVAALVRQSFGDRWLASRLAISLGVITLVVAAAGLYGTIQFLVSRRVREIGVRLALGAPPAAVRRHVLVSALRLGGLGAAAGIPLALAATRSIAALLFDTRPFDGVVYLGVAAVLLLVTIAAAMPPAWRASRIDPIQAIRTE